MKCLLALFLGIATLSAAELSGIVVAEHDGSPVAAAFVTLRSGANAVAELESDSSGLFHASLPPGDYTVTASRASYTTAERRVALTDAPADVFLQITKLGVISGRVTDQQGNGVRNIVVAAVPVPSEESPMRLYLSRPTGVATDPRGNYRIFGLPAGDYNVVALAGNARSVANVANAAASALADTSHGSTADFYPSNRSPQVLSVRSGEEHTGINFTSNSGSLFRITGTVNGPGPDTAYRVTLVAEVGGVPLASAAFEPGKQFDFDRVAPGTYKIVASRIVSNGLNDILQLINSGQIVITAANEAAILRELEAARSSNQTPKADPAFAETLVTVISQDLTGVTLSARPGVDVKIVYQPDSGCPTSTQLTLSPIQYMGAGVTNKKLETGEELTLTALPVATYSVALALPESSGCYATTPLIDLRQVNPGASIPIVVAHLGSIRGKVDTTGHQTEEFTIVLLSPDGITKRSMPLAKDSTFSIPNLRPGRYRLSALRRSLARVVAADQTITIDSGAAADVEFPVLP